MFPAGKYYVGDLCYVIADWDEFCDKTISGDSVCNGEFPWKGKKLWSHTTAYGDGSYTGSDGHEYCVDAGLIGILPVELCDKEDYQDDLTSLGNVIEFKSPFDPYYERGQFHIGHLTIDTDPPFDEDDQDEDEDY